MMAMTTTKMTEPVKSNGLPSLSYVAITKSTSSSHSGEYVDLSFLVRGKPLTSLRFFFLFVFPLSTASAPKVVRNRLVNPENLLTFCCMRAYGNDMNTTIGSGAMARFRKPHLMSLTKRCSFESCVPPSLRVDLTKSCLVDMDILFLSCGCRG